MAVARTGSILCDIRGSVGEETYSRTQGGLVVKARSVPAQPSSIYRDQAQTNLTNVSQAWSDRLTAAERLAWRTYGARYPRPNRWGEPVISSGYLAFVRSNLAKKVINTALFVDDPPVRGMLPIPIFTFVASVVGPNILITLTLDSLVLLESGFYLIITAGCSVNVGVDYYSTPWRNVRASLWNGALWAPTLGPITLPAWCGTGGKIFVRAYMFDNNSGALSVPFKASAIVS